MKRHSFNFKRYDLPDLGSTQAVPTVAVGTFLIRGNLGEKLNTSTVCVGSSSRMMLKPATEVSACESYSQVVSAETEETDTLLKESINL
jgi:hypothetical protein